MLQVGLLHHPYWGFQVLGLLCQLVTLMKLPFARVLPQEYESDNRVGDSSLARVVCTEGYVCPSQWTRNCFSYNATAGDASSRFFVLDGKVLARSVQERPVVSTHPSLWTLWYAASSI